MGDQIHCYFLTETEYHSICTALGRESMCEAPHRTIQKIRRRRARLALNAITSYSRQNARRKQATKISLDKAKGRP